MISIEQERAAFEAAIEHLSTVDDHEEVTGDPEADAMWALWKYARAQLAQRELVEIEVPDFHAEGMGCGLEDREIHDRYEAMRYGWDEAIERYGELINNAGPLYTAPPATAQPAQKDVPDADD